ncbi:MAG TPA: hypothetical protein VK722_10030 [Candidatus Aquilonibacter sp.]|jgi:hypothetical protein|nr:hypothetical protein [Candidatus Aquilonibacter sp.]
MKRLAFLFLSALILFPTVLFCQEQPKGCEFNIAGTWQSSTDGQPSSTRMRFEANGVMTELSRNTTGKTPAWQVTGKSKFKLDDPKAPKSISLTPLDKTSGTPPNTLEIKTFDNGLFVTAPADKSTALTRWTRVDPQRYFVVLAAGKGDPGFGAAGFAMLVKTDGVHTTTDAFGEYPVIHPLERHPIVGVIPTDIREEFASEPIGDSGSMLRLQVTAGPYYRALEVLKSWERRSDENSMLYAIPYLNNAVYLNQLVSSLNETGVLTWEGGTLCTETIKLQKLTWSLDDQIMSKHNLTQTPYYLFKTLRQLNNSLHLNDSQFHLALAGEQSVPVVISSR